MVHLFINSLESWSCDIFTQMWNKIEICQKKSTVLARYNGNRNWRLKLTKMNNRTINNLRLRSVLTCVKTVLIINEVIKKK